MHDIEWLPKVLTAVGWESTSSLVEGRRTENGFFKGTYLDGKRDCYRADYAGIVAVDEALVTMIFMRI